MLLDNTLKELGRFPGFIYQSLHGTAVLLLSLSGYIAVPGRVAQLVKCLTADMCLAADPGVSSSILARSHSFLEIDHEIISKAILLPSPDSRRVVVSYKRKYVHKVLVNRLVKLVWSGELAIPDMTIAVDWDVKNQTN